ncbi:TauD/TfdA dioxygenase family protein [Sciscionella sediminilitoris]|uniref:TauD/TfdA dioxygenase family protein n=1 Tax=Sciscionella sediminilitoris TaxID=1445613 RepID=UPI0004DF142C|nr:TauD/TfdA family dioxygenase [Sciscionella sp. SE31]
MQQYELDAIKAITTRERPEYTSIGVDSITPILGAEVTGVDLATELSATQIAELRAAFLDNHVLVFRDQHITEEQQKRFAEHFGQPRPVNPPPEHGDPHVLELNTDPKSENVAGNGWHADGTCDEEPSLGSMLYITEVPEGGSGGDTLFANMHLAYEMLSPALRAMLDELTALHDGGLPYRELGLTPPEGHIVHVNDHPVVVRHPDTDRRLLYVNPAYTVRLNELAADESRAVLDLLYAVVARRPVLQCRVRWAPNTLVFWDNRSVQHHATYDYYPFARYGKRVAINGGPLKG